MSTVEHFREAARMLAETEELIREGAQKGGVHLEAAMEMAPVSLAAAQVHATLALAEALNGPAR